MNMGTPSYFMFLALLSFLLKYLAVKFFDHAPLLQAHLILSKSLQYS